MVDETKICRICGEEKTLNQFYFRRDTNNYRSECSLCCNKRGRENRINNLDKYKERSRIYKNTHRDEILNKKQLYRIRNRELLREKARKYYHENKEAISERRKLHRDKSNETARRYASYKKKTDKVYLLKCQIRHLLVVSFTRKNYVKNSHLEEIVGMNINELVKYLLQTFKTNYGYAWDGVEPIHIDHIKPLKYAKTEEEVTKLCHYTNLQLLKAEDNLRKGSKLEWKIGD